MNRFVVYTEDLSGDQVERWYYGIYADKNRANEVAAELGAEFPIFHCVCEESEVKAFKIKNLPLSMM